MEIRTKFNVGDKVWVPEYYTKEGFGYYKPLKIRITNIVIGLSTLGEDRQYRSVDSPFVRSEDELFKTKAGAQKECERRNGK